jgi:hypothetical protein
MSKLINVAIVLLIMIAIVLFIHYGPPRFWGDFTGMSEAACREKLGQPFRDSRVDEDKQAQEFTIGWYQGCQVGLFLTFKDGVVVSQERVSR